MVTGSAALADYRKCPRRSIEKGKGRERATPDLWSDTTTSNSTMESGGRFHGTRADREHATVHSNEKGREMSAPGRRPQKVRLSMICGAFMVPAHSSSPYSRPADGGDR